MHANNRKASVGSCRLLQEESVLPFTLPSLNSLILIDTTHFCYHPSDLAFNCFRRVKSRYNLLRLYKFHALIRFLKSVPNEEQPNEEEEETTKNPIKQYLEQGVSRRHFLADLGAADARNGRRVAGGPAPSSGHSAMLRRLLLGRSAYL